MTQTHPLPAASGHLNYRGDQTHAIGQVVGPNRLGEWRVLVDCAYDPTTNRSRVGTAIITADEARERRG